jgi:hypothetical protein
MTILEDRWKVIKREIPEAALPMKHKVIKRVHWPVGIQKGLC